LPFPHRQWDAGTRRRILQVASTVVLTAVLVIALVPSATTLVVFLLLTLWCHGPLSPLLPAAYEPVLLGYGRLFPPLLLAITGAVASTAIEYVNYHLYQRLLRFERLDRILLSPPTRRLMGAFLRRPFLTVWLCVLTPLPDWAARILACHSRYSVRSYLTAVLLARLPRFWFLAALGLYLELGVGVVLTIIAASGVVTLIGLWRRQLMGPSSEPAAPVAGLSLVVLVSAFLPPSAVQAQEISTHLTGHAMGVSMDRFMYDGSGLMAMSYRFSTLRPGELGAELGVSLSPQALPAGVVALAPDLGVAYNISVPRGAVLIKMGGSAVVALSTAGALFVPGFHVGVH
ncbi:MAG TPA: VTT domain-containing protein, partial [Gemmatimonadales bacterium]|nr:VTT domain-containing protein [Gemmatimonadales bacterium]